MADAKSKEQLEREWWDAWWAANYSWEGLGKLKTDGEPLHPWVGWVFDKGAKSIHEADSQHAKDAVEARLRPATLQDYWRDQAGDLIASPDGAHQFTRVHLPLHWRDGTPTGKADWPDEALDAILAPKLIAGAETKVNYFGDATGADRRAQLQGAVLLRAATHPQGPQNPVHLQCTLACFGRSIDFSQQVFGPGAWFASATFSGFARFASATFSGVAVFNFATFHKDAWFTATGVRGQRKRAVFEKLAIFDSAVFKAPARLSEAQFSGRMKFDKALFGAIADFSKAAVPANERDWRGAFDGVLFERVLDLRGVEPKAVSMVAGATFDRGVMLDRTGENDEAKAHAAALKLARKAKDREEALRALEGGALKLKLAMQSESDSAREQRFYRLELRARRDQKTTKISEKLFSLMYATVASYGASIGRPFVTLALMIAVFAAGYWAWGYSIGAVQPVAVAVSQRTGPPVSGPAKATAPVAEDALIDPVDAVWSALEFSWGNVFQPLSALSTENDYLDRNALASRLLYADGGEVDMKGFFVRVAATFQSLFAIVLAFLVALAVRRKFQIS